MQDQIITPKLLDCNLDSVPTGKAYRSLGNLAHSASAPRGSSLDRALEQRRDDLALEEHKDDESGNQDQNRAGAQQGDIGRVVALERPQRTGHRSLRRVLDEHQCKEKLVPRPDGHEDSERDDRRPREWDVDVPEQVPGGRAIDPG